MLFFLAHFNVSLVQRNLIFYSLTNRLEKLLIPGILKLEFLKNESTRQGLDITYSFFVLFIQGNNNFFFIVNFDYLVRGHVRVVHIWHLKIAQEACYFLTKRARINLAALYLNKLLASTRVDYADEGVYVNVVDVFELLAF